MQNTENLAQLAEEISERLGFINFQKKFLAQKHGGQRVPPEYFVEEVNSAEQFEFFKNLTKWLLLQCRVEPTGMGTGQDPTTLCSNLLSAVEGLGFSSGEITPS